MKRITRILSSMFFYSIPFATTMLPVSPLTAAADTIQLKGGGTMYYEEVGKGTPVIFLHGHTLDRRMWADQVKALQDEYHVIVPDLRGYGLTSDPEEGYQFTHMDDVVALMDSLHIEKAHVIGLSMGGFIAGDMLGMCPERLLSCVMVSGETLSSNGPSRPRTAQEKAKLRSEGAQVARNLDAYRKRRVGVLKNACVVWNDYVRTICTEEIMDYGCWQPTHVPARIYYAHDAMVKLQKQRPDVPTLIIYGDKERTTDSSLLRFLPRGHQKVFKKCGHMVNLEYPELFNTTLIDWLHSTE